MQRYPGIGVACCLAGLLGIVAMAYAVTTLRSQKGSTLTHGELDANFTLPVGIPVELVDVDGGSCIAAAALEIPAAAGPIYWVVTCTDSASDVLKVSNIRVPYAFSTLKVSLTGVHIGGSPNGEALAFDVAAQCRKSGDANNDTWGTAQTTTLSFVTGDQNKLKSSAASSNITPNGTCSGGTNAAPLLVNLRLTVNTSGFVCATATNCKLLRLDVEFTPA